tara:strand:+ start:1122 stop:1937 length:816 start_codon:yes stop_codon:yes gene_type:complete
VEGKGSSFKKLSEWELRIHSHSAFRVLGVPFGIAESASRIFCMAEMVRGGAVEYLVRSQEKIFSSAEDRVAINKISEEIFSVDAHDQTIFTVGESILDLATLGALKNGLGAVVVENINAPKFSTWISCAASKKGFFSVVNYRSGDEGGMYSISSPVTPGEIYEGPAKSMVKLTDTLQGIFDENIFNTGKVNMLTLFCLSLDKGKSIVHDIEQKNEEGKFVKLDVDNRYSKAYRYGIFLETKTADSFLNLGRSIWLPTSDRSRNQGSIGIQE